jgi:hypothetical protein
VTAYSIYIHSYPPYLEAISSMHNLRTCHAVVTRDPPNMVHNKELHNLYSLSNIIRMIKSRRMRWAGHVARIGETRNSYRILVGKPEGKRPLGRSRRRWVDNIKIDLKRDRIVCTGSIWLRIGTIGGLL